MKKLILALIFPCLLCAQLKLGGGGPSQAGLSNAFNVVSYGAVGDNSTDNYAPFTNAFAAACAASTTSLLGNGATVYIPGAANYYKYLKVPHVPCSNLNIVGDYLNTWLVAGYSGGTSFLVGPAVGAGSLAVPTQTALLTGTGSAMTLTNSGTEYLSLTDDSSAYLNGQAAITWEFTFKPTSVAADSVIFSSGGNNGAEGAFRIGFSAGGALYCVANIGGTPVTVTAGTLVANTQYYIACDYSASTLRLYLNTSRVGTTSGTGTITQAVNEQVILPGQLQRWPDDGLVRFGPSGAIDSVRISNIARYTGTTVSVPTAKFTWDVNTQYLLNFDNQYDVFTVGQDIHNGNAHLMYRSAYGGQGLNNTGLNGLSFMNAAFGLGPIIYKDPNSNHSNLQVTGGVSGAEFTNNDFESSLTNYNAAAGQGGLSAQFQLALSAAAGVFNIYNTRLFNGQYQFAFAGGSINWVGGWFQTENLTQRNISALGDGGTVFSARGLIADSESGGSGLTNMAVFSGLDQVGIEESDFHSTATVSPFWFDNNASVKLDHVKFEGGSTSANGLIKITNSTNPILLVSPVDQDMSPAPWSDTLAKISIVSPTLLFFPSLPTSCSGKSTGTVWNNSNVLTICP